MHKGEVLMSKLKNSTEGHRGPEDREDLQEVLLARDQLQQPPAPGRQPPGVRPPAHPGAARGPLQRPLQQVLRLQEAEGLPAAQQPPLVQSIQSLQGMYKKLHFKVNLNQKYFPGPGLLWVHVRGPPGRALQPAAQLHGGRR